jgi:hypothetical protein
MTTIQTLFHGTEESFLDCGSPSNRENGCGCPTLFIHKSAMLHISQNTQQSS